MTAKKKPSREQKLLELVKFLEDLNEIDYHIHDMEEHRTILWQQVNEIKKELKIK